MELDGTRATNGPSDSIDVRGDAKTDPAVTTAQQITCGDRTKGANGIAEQH